MTGPETAGPLLAAGLWREVIDRAGERCECGGQCGRKHKDGQGRCTRENPPWAPLHAVPRQPVPLAAAAALPARDLHALCAACHDAITTQDSRARRAGAVASDPLF